MFCLIFRSKKLAEAQRDSRADLKTIWAHCTSVTFVVHLLPLDCESIFEQHVDLTTAITVVIMWQIWAADAVAQNDPDERAKGDVDAGIGLVVAVGTGVGNVVGTGVGDGAGAASRTQATDEWKLLITRLCVANLYICACNRNGFLHIIQRD